jgi:hypothetical protein
MDEIDEVFTDLGSAELVEVDWLIKDLLPSGLIIMGAPPKAGKSTFEMAMSLLVAGLPCKALPSFMGDVVKRGVVAGWSYEATAGELKHMCEVGLGVAVPADRSILIADNPWLFRLDDEDGLSRLLGWLDKINPMLAWLDPLRDFHVLEEKDSGQMNRLLRPLQAWAKDHGSAVLVVHHTKKKDEGDFTANDLRGSNAIFGIADGVLMLTPKGHGMTNIKATFKRAQGWDRTIRIASYEYLTEGAWEHLGDVENKTLKLIEGGAPNLEAIATQLKVGKSRIVQALAALERAGLVTNKHGKWSLTGRRLAVVAEGSSREK